MTEVFVEPGPGESGDPTIRVPRVPLIGAGILVLIVFALAISAQRYGTGAAKEGGGTVVERRMLAFSAAQDGGMNIDDIERRVRVAHLLPDKNGFLFGMMRGIEYKRRVARADLSAPFEVTRWSDGRLTLDDRASGMHVTVNSFGPTQVASFEQLFAKDAAP